MKTLTKHIIMIITATFFFGITLSGCGSSSGNQPVRKAKASVKTAGLVAAGLFVETLDITISFPIGITVALSPGTTYDSSPTTHNLIASVVQCLDKNGLPIDPGVTLSALTYTPATPTTQGSLRIVYLNAEGFTPSDSLLIQLDITPGSSPKESDFSLTKFQVTPVSITMSGGTAVFTNYSAKPVLNPIFTTKFI